jgi:hypothetical protein
VFRGAPLAAVLRGARAARLAGGLLAAASAACAACIAPRALEAQSPGAPDTARTAPVARAGGDTTSVDSLAARLARAEAAIALLRRQLGVEAQSGVRTRSRFALELRGLVLTNAFHTAGRANITDVPLFALPSTAYYAGEDALGLTVRQTRLGAAFVVEEVLGGRFEADLDVDFFGGVPPSPGGRLLFPEIRLRTAEGRLVWSRTEVMVGTTRPLVSDINPLSVAAVGVTGFVAAGNLWNWLPQLRITQEIGAMPIGGSALRWAVQGAVLEPHARAEYSGETEVVGAGERSGRPYLEGRLRARWGDDEHGTPTDAMRATGGGEIGISAHRGWLEVGERELRTSRAVAIDAHVSLGTLVELRGEAYRGELLSGLGGGGIGQNFGAPPAGTGVGATIRDVAGWAQVNVQAHPLLVAGAGCGIDDPEDDDAPERLRNASCAAHLLWRPAQPLVLGLEYRRTRTRYATETMQVRHVNLAFGVEF